MPRLAGAFRLHEIPGETPISSCGGGFIVSPVCLIDRLSLENVFILSQSLTTESYKTPELYSVPLLIDDLRC